jgi:hypothetical protein
MPTDDAYPAATATVLTYTANPTAGTPLGALWTGRVASPAVDSAPLGNLEVAVPWPTPVTLTGTTDVLAWTMGGAALPPGLTVQASVWWTEN